MDDNGQLPDYFQKRKFSFLLEKNEKNQPEITQFQEEAKKLIDENIWYWDEEVFNRKLTLPEAISDINKLRSENLEAYREDEDYQFTTDQFAYDENKNRRKLTPEQYKEIIKFGTFSAGDEKQHNKCVWKLNRFLIKGVHNIKETFYDNLAYAAYLLYECAPLRFVGERFSVKSAVRCCVTFGIKLMDIFIGIPHVTIRKDNLVERILEEEMRSFISEIELNEEDKMLFNQFQYFITLLRLAFEKKKEIFKFYYERESKLFLKITEKVDEINSNEEISNSLEKVNLKVGEELMLDSVIAEIIASKIIENNIADAQTIRVIQKEIERILFILSRKSKHIVSFSTLNGESFDCRLIDRSFRDRIESILPEILSVNRKEEIVQIQKIHQTIPKDKITKEIVNEQLDVWYHNRIEQQIEKSRKIEDLCEKHFPNNSSEIFKKNLIRHIKMFVFVDKVVRRFKKERTDTIVKEWKEECKKHQSLSRLDNWHRMKRQLLNYKYDEANQFRLHLEILKELRHLNNDNDNDEEMINDEGIANNSQKSFDTSSFIYHIISRHLTFWRDRFPSIYSSNIDILHERCLKKDPKKIFNFSIPTIFPKNYEIVRTVHCGLFKYSFNLHGEHTNTTKDSSMKSIICEGIIPATIAKKTKASARMIDYEVEAINKFRNENQNLIMKVNNDSNVNNDDELRYDYQMRTKTYLKVSTSSYFWRWKIFFCRYASWLKKSVLLFFIALPFAYRFSFRALFTCQPFQTTYRLNSDTHQIELNPNSSYTPTLWSLLRSLWKHVHRSNERFENEHRHGLISKSSIRPFFWLWNYFIKGCCGSTILLISHPILSITIPIISIIIGTLSPILVLICVVLRKLFCIFCYDFDLPHYSYERTLWKYQKHVAKAYFFPIFDVIFFRFLTMIVLQPIAAILTATIFCPVISLFITLYTSTRFVFRWIWDKFIFFLFIKNRAHIPVQTYSWVVRLIVGPNMTTKYFLQPHPQYLQMLFLINLELAELERFEKFISKQLHHPIHCYVDFMKNMFRPFVQDLNTQNYNRLMKKTTEFTDKVFSKTKNRKDELLKLLKTQRSIQSNNHYKLQHDVLIEFLATCEYFIRKLYRDHLDSYSDDTIWNMMECTVDDWNDLTKLFVRKYFHSDLLIPLEESDQFMSLNVNHVSVTSYFRDLFQNSVHDDLEQFIIEYQKQNYLTWNDYHCQFISPHSIFPEIQATNEWIDIIREQRWKKSRKNHFYINSHKIAKKRLNTMTIHTDQLTTCQLIQLQKYPVLQFLMLFLKVKEGNH